MELVDRLLLHDAAALCHHKHGHKVALAVLEHGTSLQRGRITASLCSEAARAARHRFAAEVVAEALLHSDSGDALRLAAVVVAKPGTVVSLACHCFGVNVVRSLLRLPQFSRSTLQEIKRGQKKLQKDKFGAEILVELGQLDIGSTGGDCAAPRGGA
eukprot:SRR837773.11011.p1 GENE.SRR837773.11011~~SRR837773.11011.p1  ORF type:complete len:166 (-),score=43.89 SRR837773.11011:164-634(-)